MQKALVALILVGIAASVLISWASYEASHYTQKTVAVCTQIKAPGCYISCQDTLMELRLFQWSVLQDIGKPVCHDQGWVEP